MIGVITNPNSKKNRRTPDRAAELSAIVGDMGIVRQTKDVDAIGPVLHEFVDRGVTTWVSDGGDGALHWMLNVGRRVLVERGAPPDAPGFPPIVPTNGGTIDFVAKKASVHGHAPEILGFLVSAAKQGRKPAVVSLDTLWIEGDSAEGRGRFGRLGFACAVAGVGQRFFAKYYEYPNPGSATIVKVISRAIWGYFASTWPLSAVSAIPARARDYARTLFKPVQADVSVDGRHVEFRDFTAIHAGSIDVDLGGVLRIFPLAHDPGHLHFQAGAPTPVEMMRNIPKLYRGEMFNSRNFLECMGERLDVRATNGEHLDPVIDGELVFGLENVSITRGPIIPVAVVP